VVIIQEAHEEEEEEEKEYDQEQFQQLMKSRTELLQEQCDQQGEESVINPHVMFVLKERSLVWCPVYKAASTNWMYNLLYLAGRSDTEVEETKARHPNQPNDAGREVAPLMSHSSLMSVVGQQNSTRLLIVRHPFDRLVSAFRDKLEQCHGPKNCTLQNNWYYKTYGRRIVSQYRKGAVIKFGDDFFSSQNNYGAPFPVLRTWRSEKMPSWWEFVQSLLSTPPSSYDEHWMPISLYCSPCSLPYNRILHSEYIQEEEHQVALEMGAGHLIKPRWENKNTGTWDKESLLERYFSLLSDDDITALYSIYKDDFLLFGYTFSFRGLNFNVL